MHCNCKKTGSVFVMRCDTNILTAFRVRLCVGQRPVESPYVVIVAFHYFINSPISYVIFGNLSCYLKYKLMHARLAMCTYKNSIVASLNVYLSPGDKYLRLRLLMTQK